MPDRKPLEFDVPRDIDRSYCASCGAGIYWIETVAGKRMPLSARTERETDDGRRVAQSHFSDCPNAAHHRRKTRAP